MIFIKPILRSMAVAVLAVVFMTPTAPAYSADRTEPVVIPIVSDSSTDVVAVILGATLEKAGFRVKYVEADYTASFSGIQTGDLHFSICWQSTWDLCIGSTEGGKAVHVGASGIMSREGWWYPVSLKKSCPGLPDWRALKEPACIDALATAETAPKARFIEGPADWIMPVKEMATAFDINVEPIASGSAAALVATISSAGDRGEPVIGWGYTPHWYFMSNAGEFVSFPEYAPACQTDASWGINPNATHDCDVQTGPLSIFANKAILDTSPEISAIVAAFQLKNSQVAGVLKSSDVDGVPMQDAVAAWMNSNEAIWSAWLK